MTSVDVDAGATPAPATRAPACAAGDDDDGVEDVAATPAVGASLTTPCCAEPPPLLSSAGFKEPCGLEGREVVVEEEGSADPAVAVETAGRRSRAIGGASAVIIRWLLEGNVFGVVCG